MKRIGFLAFLLLIAQSVHPYTQDADGKIIRFFEHDESDDAALKAVQSNESWLKLKTSDQRTPLHDAAMKGLPKTVQYLISKKLSVKDVTDLGSTPLHLVAYGTYANRQGSVDACNILINADAEIDAKDAGNATPLHNAAKLNNYEICKILLDKGANPNNVSTWSTEPGTPLYQAADRNHIDVCRLLIKEGANIDQNEGNMNNNTALHIAAQRGFYDLCKLLLDNGANPNIKNKIGNSEYPALSRAFGADRDKVDNLALLIAQNEKTDLSFVYEDGATFLHFAALTGALETCKYLISKGLSITARDKEGRTPLHWAVVGNHQETYNLLKNQLSDDEFKELHLDRSGNLEASAYEKRYNALEKNFKKDPSQKIVPGSVLKPSPKPNPIPTPAPKPAPIPIPIPMPKPAPGAKESAIFFKDPLSQKLDDLKKGLTALKQKLESLSKQLTALKTKL